MAASGRIHYDYKQTNTMRHQTEFKDPSAILVVDLVAVAAIQPVQHMLIVAPKFFKKTLRNSRILLLSAPFPTYTSNHFRIKLTHRNTPLVCSKMCSFSWVLIVEAMSESGSSRNPCCIPQYPLYFHLELDRTKIELEIRG